jgi:hypothetical protein
MKKLIQIVLVLLSTVSFAQTGVIKGKIIDKQSESSIAGATIILNANKEIAATSDEKGSFVLKAVPIGRQTITVSFIGYENAIVSELEVTTGKDLDLTIVLIESFNKLEEIVIKNEFSKVKPINKMAAVSTRQFSVEEVNRYAGGRSDVARLAANFAGVSTADDSRNDIVVRGNSPSGMLWRIEGIPVPSPNHFSTLGTTGSPVSALNPNLLANSDFMTSAFPAEYGNAISGVFDLNFRKGNKDDYEYTASIGAFPGAEFMAEGPLGKKQGSFLVAGRYGVAGFFGAGGTSAQPNYNDLSFNIDLGTGKWGNLSFFGIAGTSNIDFIGKDADAGDLFAAKDEDAFVTSNFGAVGIKHTIKVNENSFFKTILGGSTSSNTYDADRYINFETPQEEKIRYTENDNTESRITFSTLFNSKLNSKITIRSGLLFEQFSLDANLTDRDRQADNDGDGLPDFVSIYDTNGSYQIIQPYAQGQFRLTQTITLNSGLHAQYFSLNEQFVVEPRASITWAFLPKHSFNFGYGLHHQNVVAPLLFQKGDVGGNLVETNKNLDLVSSQHFVFGYDVKLADKWRGKVELYYQSIEKAAVEKFASSYSSLTEGADFGFSVDKPSLVSKGTGFNQGVEFTLEKFFSKGYHGLFTTSFFESKYKGSDGIERNSPFNNRYVINALAGKEFKIGKQKRNIFSINTKITTAGGRFYTPVDLAASNAAGYEITDDTKAFSKQYDPYFRIDLKFGMKINSKTKKQSHQFYVDLQNVTNNDNIFVDRYNRLTNRVDTVYQIGFFPDFGYKFQF